MAQQIPEISKTFACIVNRDDTVLAAVVSSYLARPGEYIPMFEFPFATIAKTDGDEDIIDEHGITRSRSEEFNVFVSNCIGRNGVCENLILAGLSAEQKSYLSFLGKYNVIEIPNIEQVDFSLSAFATEKVDYLSCRAGSIQQGLYQAAHENLKLKIDDTAIDLDEMELKEGGLVVIESISAVSSIIAVNYSIAINANVKIVEALAENEAKEVSYLIQEWKKGADARYHELSDKVHKRLGGIYFPSYEFATFFTEGLPYSLVLHDPIPCTCVHLLYKPDLFIFNCLFFEKEPNINSAIVFSPELFKDEETNFVIKSLDSQNIYVRELTGKSASVYNMEMHVKEFPYDLLHICSHGGEVNGYSITESFKDRNGNSHTIEYDEVISFEPNPYDKLIPVSRKTIFRKFDGLVWGSDEFREKKYPHYIFADVEIQMHKMFQDKTHKPKRIPKAVVPDSCGIKCSDFVYQGMIHVVTGSHTAPIIFNNSCWSWSGIADSYLAGGVRGYIGTLWKVDNKIATQVAKTFYDCLFNDTILCALQKGIEACRGTDYEGIYVYWGLHFSTIQKGTTPAKSRENVLHLLLRAFYRWMDQREKVKSKAVGDSIKSLENWNMEQIRRYFFIDYMKLRATFKK